MRRLDRDFALNEWVPALRSGNYKQTRERLRDENGYCCLGVVCDIAGSKWSSYTIYETDEEGDEVELTGYAVLDDVYENRENLPSGITDKYGFVDANSVSVSEANVGRVPTFVKFIEEHVPVNGTCFHYNYQGVININLAALNDAGMTFEQLANLIEEVVDTYETD